MNNMFAQQTADAIETLTARDDSLRKALTFLARRIKAIDGHIGIDSAQAARATSASKAIKPRARWDGKAWQPDDRLTPGKLVALAEGRFGNRLEWTGDDYRPAN